jgi:DNA-binding MurR/RpiR family transcriptional regulator
MDVHSEGSDMTAPPTTFGQLKGAIAAQYAGLSRQLQQIAEFALEHPNDVAFGTVAQLADRAGVQPSSLVRFAKSLGYDGFSDMQQIFRARLATSAPSYRERVEALRRDADGARSEAAVLDRFVGDGIAALDHLRQGIDAGEIGRAAALVADAREVYVLGQGRSFPVAFYLSYALHKFELSVQLIDGVGGLGRERLRRAGSRDAAIAISFKDYTPEVVEQVQSLAERSVPVVAITDSALSPIAAAAAVTFEIEDTGSQPFRSLVAPMCLSQALAVTIGERLTAPLAQRRAKAAAGPAA